MSPSGGTAGEFAIVGQFTTCLGQQRPQPQQRHLKQDESRLRRYGRKPVDRGLRFLHISVGPAGQQRFDKNGDCGRRGSSISSVSYCCSTIVNRPSIAPTISPVLIFSFAYWRSTIGTMAR